MPSSLYVLNTLEMLNEILEPRDNSFQVAAIDLVLESVSLPAGYSLRKDKRTVVHGINMYEDNTIGFYGPSPDLIIDPINNKTAITGFSPSVLGNIIFYKDRASIISEFNVALVRDINNAAYFDSLNNIEYMYFEIDFTTRINNRLCKIADHYSKRLEFLVPPNYKILLDEYFSKC